MTAKNFGPLVSGYLVPDDRSWETSVFQAGKPVLDKELNLAGDISTGNGQAAMRLAMPSGWLSQSFLGQSDPAVELFVPSMVSNEIIIPTSLLAHVNGWLVRVADTNTNTEQNVLDLGTAPVGAGARRFDLVVLEVWRRLVAASPSVDGKSALARIWRYGNVKIPAASDAALNFDDDLLDTNVGSETTKRVQIQYRLRVIQGVDLFAYPAGISDPTVVANTVPVGALFPDGNPTAFTYVNQSGNGDAGLWVAGDGNPANGLGTVDGFMYALPLLAVARRNTTAFDKNTNHNGEGPGRPDGLLADILVPPDVIDLRSGVSPTGWNYAEVLERNVNRILDNSLRSEITTTAPQGGGCDGSIVLWADEIGITNAHGGDGVTTGDTPGAEFVGEFDAVRRGFSDRSVYEVATLKIDAPVGGWVDGEVVTISPTALPVYPYAAFNWAAYNNARVQFMDIVDARWIGPSGMAPLRMNYSAMSRIQTIAGLGVQPVNDLTITFTDIATALGLTDEPLYLDLLIAYPSGLGLSKTATRWWGLSLNNPAQMPAAAPVSYSQLGTISADPVHREVQIRYNTVNLTFSCMVDSEVAPGDTFRLPERAESIVSVLRNGNPLVGAVTLSSDGRVGTFTDPADFTAPFDDLEVVYVAVRPFPQNNEQVTLYYDAAAPQAVREAHLPLALTLTPRYISPRLHVLTTGSGSQDEGYPFPMGYVQTGGVFPSTVGAFAGEHELAARGDVSVADFSAATGFITLPTFIGYMPSPEGVVFLRGVGDVDAEGRSFYKSVPAPAYVPNAYAQDLSDAKRHKVVLPMLAELAQDSVLGPKGQLVTVLLMRWARLDATNGLWFDSDLTSSTTSACVFRTSGNLLNGKM